MVVLLRKEKTGESKGQGKGG